MKTLNFCLLRCVLLWANRFRVHFLGVLTLSTTASLSMPLPLLADTTAGPFRLPFNEFQEWQACSQKGFFPLSNPDHSQFYMHYETDVDPHTGQAINKYHMGEDRNGICEGNTDLGGPLYPLATGQVVAVDRTGATAKGKWIQIRYTFADGSQVDSQHLHCDTILVQQNDIVTPEEEIATIGGTGGWPVHLHWEIHTDIHLPQINDYQKPLPVKLASQLTSPSLFIDDRTFISSTVLNTTTWTYINPKLISATAGIDLPNGARTSTAYVDYPAETHFTFYQAWHAGLISGVYWWTGQQWQLIGDVTDLFFQPSVTYALQAKLGQPILNLNVPGDHYRNERARMDMVHAALQDSRFLNVRSEHFSINLGWDPDWELRQMDFDFSGKNGLQELAVYQITYKANPLVRYTAYYDPDADGFTNWAWIDWNLPF
jgi:hypothetical protein